MNTEKDKLLIVGGYGAVGRTVSTELAKQFPGRVIAAGRDEEKARRLAQSIEAPLLPLSFDVSAFETAPTVLDDVALVIMLLDQPDTRWARWCLEKKCHYIDVTASYNWMQQMENLDTLAKENEVTAVLSVGLVPGLSNLLAAYARDQFDVLAHIDISLMLGLGEKHGKAAIQWMIEHLQPEYTVLDNGVTKQVAPFTEGKEVNFPAPVGARMAYRFNLPDQHVLPKTLGLPSVSTRLAFDSAKVTALLAQAKQRGATRLLNISWVRNLLIKAMTHIHMGTEQFIVQVDAVGTLQGRANTKTYSVAGENEARMTGLVAAEVASRVLENAGPSGVLHIEQLCAPQAMFDALRTKGLTTQLS